MEWTREQKCIAVNADVACFISGALIATTHFQMQCIRCCRRRRRRDDLNRVTIKCGTTKYRRTVACIFVAARACVEIESPCVSRAMPCRMPCPVTTASGRGQLQRCRQCVHTTVYVCGNTSCLLLCNRTLSSSASQCVSGRQQIKTSVLFKTKDLSKIN